MAALKKKLQMIFCGYCNRKQRAPSSHHSQSIDRSKGISNFKNNIGKKRVVNLLTSEQLPGI